MQRLLAFSLFTIGIFNSGLCANVKWAKPEMSIEASPTDDEIKFEFKFVNSGKQPIKFIEVQASCGCTLPKIDTKTYAPNENGEITGAYKPGSRRGLSTVHLTVKGEEIDGETRRPFSDNLKLSVFVPELVGISPGITLWKKDSDPEEKRVRLEVKQNDPLVIKLVGLNNNAFTANLFEVFPGRAYDLVVKPKVTTESIQCMATMEATDANGKPIKLFAHFIIR